MIDKYFSGLRRYSVKGSILPKISHVNSLIPKTYVLAVKKYFKMNISFSNNF